MEQSTYYKLNLVTGSDLVNPLVQDKPNYETIDMVMHNNAIASVGTATALKSDTVFTLTRADETPCFTFTATSDYASGDTFTVDGNVVTATLPNGNALPDKAFTTNADVICVLNGSHLTVYGSGASNESAIKELQDAVSEIDDNIDAIEEEIGDVETLTTSSKEVVGAINELDDSKQDELVSGTSIKTINGESVLGSGDLTIGSSGIGFIDFSHEIKSGEVLGNYTATENCWVNMEYSTSGGLFYVQINDVTIYEIQTPSTQLFRVTIPVAKGDRIYSTGTNSYTVYGMK